MHRVGGCTRSTAGVQAWRARGTVVDPAVGRPRHLRLQGPGSVLDTEQGIPRVGSAAGGGFRGPGCSPSASEPADSRTLGK